LLEIFQDGNLTDALKNLACDMDGDKRVKKKLLLVLLAWDEQYKDDPNMNFVAGVLKHYGSGLSRRSARPSQGSNGTSAEGEGSASRSSGEEKKEKKKVDVLAELSKSERATPKRKKEKKKQEEQPQQQNQRVPFDFEKVMPFPFVLQSTGSEVRTCRIKKGYAKHS
jgi:hypothetical protein